MSNSADPDETAHYEPSHLDLCCLQKSVLSPMAVRDKGNTLASFEKRLHVVSGKTI